MSEREMVDIEVEKELYDRINRIAENEGVTPDKLTEIFLAGYLQGSRETIKRKTLKGETNQVTITLPKGYWKALEFLLDLEGKDTVEEYVSRTLKGDLDCQFEDTTYLGEYLQPKIKKLIETN